MARKNPIQKLQDAVVGTVGGVVADPKGSAGKAAGQVRGLLSLGLTVAGQVAGQVADRLSGGDEPSPPPYGSGRPDLRVAEPTELAEPTADDGPEVAAKPTDVARAVAKKAPPAKRAAPSTPSDKLPPRKEPAKRTAAKKAPAKKAPVKKAPAKKAPAPAPQGEAEPLLDPALTKAVASEAETGARAADPDKG